MKKHTNDPKKKNLLVKIAVFLEKVNGIGENN